MEREWKKRAQVFLKPLNPSNGKVIRQESGDKMSRDGRFKTSGTIAEKPMTKACRPSRGPRDADGRPEEVSSGRSRKVSNMGIWRKAKHHASGIEKKACLGGEEKWAEKRRKGWISEKEGGMQITFESKKGRPETELMSQEKDQAASGTEGEKTKRYEGGKHMTKTPCGNWPYGERSTK